MRDLILAHIYLLGFVLFKPGVTHTAMSACPSGSKMLARRSNGPFALLCRTCSPSMLLLTSTTLWLKHGSRRPSCGIYRRPYHPAQAEPRKMYFWGTGGEAPRLPMSSHGMEVNLEKVEEIDCMQPLTHLKGRSASRDAWRPWGGSSPNLKNAAFPSSSYSIYQVSDLTPSAGSTLG